jgi:hypothetical protein
MKKTPRLLGQALRAALGIPTRVAPPARPFPSRRVEPHHPELEPDARAPVWIVVPSGIQYFRFLETNAFAEVEAAYRVKYVFPDPEGRHRIPATMDRRRHRDVLFVPVDEKRYAAWSMLFEVSCCALASRSVSFRIRHEMTTLARRDRPLPFAQRVYRRLVPALASRPLFGRFRRNLVRALGTEPTMARALADERPAAILLPSSLHDCLTNDVIVTARAAGVPTIVLQTSWDNLSSKGIVAVPPDVMGVWGEQSVRHAVALQGMTRERCVVVGSPYYEGLFRPRRRKADARRALGLPPDGLLVLFGGAFRQFDEVALLRRLEDAIDTGRLPKMLIFYRPHPGRELRDETSFFDGSWKHAILDEEVAAVYRANQTGRMISQNEFGYSLDRLADIYAAADLTISPMSSIMLESLLVGVPVLGIGYSDGRNRWGPDKTSQMTHFDELRAAAGVRICHSPSSVEDDLRTVLGWAARAETALETREATRYFVDNGSVGYARNVVDLLQRSVAAPASTSWASR